MLECEGDQLITGKCSECLEAGVNISQDCLSLRESLVSRCFAVILLWCVQQSLPILLDTSPPYCQDLSATSLLLSYTSDLESSLRSQARQKLSRSLSWRIINSLIWEFVTNSSWSVGDVRCHDAIIYFDPNWAPTRWGWLCSLIPANK